MRVRLSALAAAAILLLATLSWTPALGASDAAAPRPVVVAVLDTGILPTHREFNYGGPSDATDQIVAWWDFTSARKSMSVQQDPFRNPGPDGQIPLWDPHVPTPYDDQGHGTATASLVGGLNRWLCKTSYAPGVKLAILRVLSGEEAAVMGPAHGGDLALAIRYAAEVVRADVISMSVGGQLPVMGLSEPEVTEQVKRARQAGVLVVVSAGNGVGNQGVVPSPTEVDAYSGTADVLSVGGGAQSGETLTSTTGNMDPEVSAWSDSVCSASHETSMSYRRATGTSFSAPLVAGAAAAAIAAARATGAPDDPAWIEAVLKHAARDTVAPYAREGWGFIGHQEVAKARLHAASATLPHYEPYGGMRSNPNEMYEESVADPLRDAADGPFPASGRGVIRLLPISPGTGPGRLGPGIQGTVFEAERHALTVTTSDVARIEVTYPRGPNSFRHVLAPFALLEIYPSHALEDGALEGEERLAVSTAEPREPQVLDWRPPGPGSYTAVVMSDVIDTPAEVVLVVTGAEVAFEEENLAYHEPSAS